MLTVPAAGLLAAATLAACGDDTASSGDGLDVVAAFYPLAFAAEQVGGDGVTVTNLTPAGQEPHDLELAPSDIAAIEEADYIVYLEGFMPEFDQAVSEYAADKALEIGSAVDLLDYSEDTENLEDHDHAEEGHAEEDHAEGEHHDHEHTTEGTDPHVWLDPLRYATVGEAIADGLADIDEAGADAYAAGAEDFTTALTELDAEFTEGLADRTSDDIVTSHAAFGYLADRYGLHQIAISGVSPDQEPDTQRMAEIAEFVETHQVTTIFFETLVSPDIAQTLADETGVQTAVLNPIEGLTEDDADADYFSVMRDNLAALRVALGSS
ncbi:metal ABC transporter substrate-binding protein [Glycomyces arizonensis]|uniref:metal ABC transporter substrate-binding protein n=1 Tax=Glycomyces arizonensis TaxID=256035 RepID=UPI00316AD7C4